MTFFFLIFREKPPFIIHIIGQKTLFSAKTLLYYRPKESTGCPFFLIFHGKVYALMAIFCQNTVHSVKNPQVSCPYFTRKTSILSKHCALMAFFFKNPLLSCTRTVKNTSILSKLHSIMVQKS